MLTSSAVLINLGFEHFLCGGISEDSKSEVPLLVVLCFLLREVYNEGKEPSPLHQKVLVNEKPAKISLSRLPTFSSSDSEEQNGGPSGCGYKTSNWNMGRIY